MSLRGMKIGRRAGLSFSVIAFLVLSMGLLSLFEAKKMDAVAEDIRTDWLPGVLVIGDIGTSLGRTRALTLRSILLENNVDRERTVGIVRSLNKNISESLEAYEKSIQAPEERKTFENFKSAYAIYAAYQGKILDAVLSSAH